MKALEDFHTCIGLPSNHSKLQIVFGGCDTRPPQQCLQITGFQVGGLPFKCLGVPMTATRLSKLECRVFLDTIMGKLKTWLTKSISFTGRAQLLSSIISGMYNYWVTIFIFPQDVIENINQMCRNYLWGGHQILSGSPPFPGRLHVYLRNRGALHGTKHPSPSWSRSSQRKKTSSGLNGCMESTSKMLIGGNTVHPRITIYSRVIAINTGNGKKVNILLAKVINGYWERWNIKPGASSYGHNQLSPGTLLPHGCFTTNGSQSRAEEDLEHVFFNCGWAQAFWQEIISWWPIPISLQGFTTTIYQIWRARNLRIFENKDLPLQATVAQTKEQIIQRILFLNSKSGKYTDCIDKLLG
ncbi:hypothetical protein Cgig2_017104 [Carnegiea gigantea]|uniref:Reverse transcriptase n=1 Tax=Carnegiea gigantea TaxID=171969 RepID=A0A9Q1GR22_9CARY|nr:hypothetical protein Cgig2_017104 [Carnegiea gigantea]